MIGILGKGTAPDEALARTAQAAVPYPTPEMTFRRIGDVLLGIATRPAATTPTRALLLRRWQPCHGRRVRFRFRLAALAGPSSR